MEVEKYLLSFLGQSTSVAYLTKGLTLREITEQLVFA